MADKKTDKKVVCIGRGAPYKKFKVSFEIEGRMVDKDTRIGKESLEDFFNMSCPKGLKIERLEIEEMKEIG